MSFLTIMAAAYCDECPCYGTPSRCVCTQAEAVVRCYAGGWPRTAMTPAQREACMHEISAVEGYVGSDFVDDSDQVLARVVLLAWLDACRDKGL